MQHMHQDRLSVSVWMADQAGGRQKRDEDCGQDHGAPSYERRRDFSKQLPYFFRPHFGLCVSVFVSHKLCSLSQFELVSYKVEICPFLIDQRGVRACLHYPTAVEHYNSVGIPDRREAVGYHHYRTAFVKSGKVLHYRALVFASRAFVASSRKMKAGLR